jgi:predicted nucleic acid-binding protein
MCFRPLASFPVTPSNLKDPDDDMLLELAVMAECQRIVTFNERDFHGIEQFGIRAISPQEFLSEIGVIR